MAVLYTGVTVTSQQTHDMLSHSTSMTESPPGVSATGQCSEDLMLTFSAVTLLVGH